MRISDCGLRIHLILLFALQGRAPDLQEAGTLRRPMGLYALCIRPLLQRELSDRVCTSTLAELPCTQNLFRRSGRTSVRSLLRKRSTLLGKDHPTRPGFRVGESRESAASTRLRHARGMLV